jgi:outer membrane protein assembly factor BamD
MLLRLVLLLSLSLITFSCSNKDESLYVPTKKIDPYETYREGLRAFNDNNFFFASKKFTNAEINFTSPSAAGKAAIMASFSLYAINFYNEAEENILRYLKNYPSHEYKIYANYLLAIISYEQIGDEKHDLKPLLEAKKKIDFFLKEYPESEYAIDLTLKKNLVINQFAARELYIAKYYINVQKWVPAINRLKIIVNDYNTTVFIEEALHRLVEIYYHIGLEEEAKNYASVLGYNYNSSEWFKQSYKILNKDYTRDKVKKESERDKKEIFKKIIDLIKLD